MACLINGPSNGIVVYGISKEMKLELFSQFWFTTGPTIIDKRSDNTPSVS